MNSGNAGHQRYATHVPTGSISSSFPRSGLSQHQQSQHFNTYQQRDGFQSHPPPKNVNFGGQGGHIQENGKFPTSAGASNGPRHIARRSSPGPRLYQDGPQSPPLRHPAVPSRSNSIGGAGGTNGGGNFGGGGGGACYGESTPGSRYSRPSPSPSPQQHVFAGSRGYTGGSIPSDGGGDCSLMTGGTGTLSMPPRSNITSTVITRVSGVGGPPLPQLPPPRMPFRGNMQLPVAMQAPMPSQIMYAVTPAFPGSAVPVGVNMYVPNASQPPPLVAQRPAHQAPASLMMQKPSPSRQPQHVQQPSFALPLLAPSHQRHPASTIHPQFQQPPQSSQILHQNQQVQPQQLMQQQLTYASQQPTYPATIINPQQMPQNQILVQQQQFTQQQHMTQQQQYPQQLMLQQHQQQPQQHISLQPPTQSQYNDQQLYSGSIHCNNARHLQPVLSSAGDTRMQSVKVYVQQGQPQQQPVNSQSTVMYVAPTAATAVRQMQPPSLQPRSQHIQQMQQQGYTTANLPPPPAGNNSGGPQMVLYNPVDQTYRFIQQGPSTIQQPQQIVVATSQGEAFSSQGLSTVPRPLPMTYTAIQSPAGQIYPVPGQQVYAGQGQVVVGGPGHQVFAQTGSDGQMMLMMNQPPQQGYQSLQSTYVVSSLPGGSATTNAVQFSQQTTMIPSSPYIAGQPQVLVSSQSVQRAPLAAYPPTSSHRMPAALVQAHTSNPTPLQDFSVPPPSGSLSLTDAPNTNAVAVQAARLNDNPSTDVSKVNQPAGVTTTETRTKHKIEILNPATGKSIFDQSDSRSPRSSAGNKSVSTRPSQQQQFTLVPQQHGSQPLCLTQNSKVMMTSVLSDGIMVVYNASKSQSYLIENNQSNVEACDSRGEKKSDTDDNSCTREVDIISNPASSNDSSVSPVNICDDSGFNSTVSQIEVLPDSNSELQAVDVHVVLTSTDTISLLPVCCAEPEKPSEQIEDSLSTMEDQNMVSGPNYVESTQIITAEGTIYDYKSEQELAKLSGACDVRASVYPDEEPIHCSVMPLINDSSLLDDSVPLITLASNVKEEESHCTYDNRKLELHMSDGQYSSSASFIITSKFCEGIESNTPSTFNGLSSPVDQSLVNNNGDICNEKHEVDNQAINEHSVNALILGPSLIDSMNVNEFNSSLARTAVTDIIADHGQANDIYIHSLHLDDDYHEPGSRKHSLDTQPLVNLLVDQHQKEDSVDSGTDVSEEVIGGLKLDIDESNGGIFWRRGLSVAAGEFQCEESTEDKEVDLETTVVVLDDASSAQSESPPVGSLDYCAPEEEECLNKSHAYDMAVMKSSSVDVVDNTSMAASLSVAEKKTTAPVMIRRSASVPQAPLDRFIDVKPLVKAGGSSRATPSKQPYQKTAQSSTGRLRYDRNFLLQLQFAPESLQRPVGLPNMPDVIVNMPAAAVISKTVPVLHRMPTSMSYSNLTDFTPGYVKPSPGGGMGRGGVVMAGGMGSIGRARGQRYNMLVMEPPTPPAHKVISVSLQNNVRLHTTENAWKVQQKAANDDSLDPEQKATEILYRKFRSILNKLTPQNIEKLNGEIRSFIIDTEERLSGCIGIIFEKAISEPNFSSSYSQTANSMIKLQVPLQDRPDEVVTFRKLLLNRCQKEFERDRLDELDIEQMQDEIDKTEAEDKKKLLIATKDQAVTKARRRSLGNIRFIGELFKLKMLTEKIMHDCIKKLLDACDEDSLECLCRLLATIGKDLDLEKSKHAMNAYIDKLERKSCDKAIPARIRFMLRDIVELRQHKWVPRRVDNNPRTIQQIHDEAQAEQEQRQLSMLMSSRGMMVGQGVAAAAAAAEQSRRRSEAGLDTGNHYGPEDWALAAQAAQAGRQVRCPIDPNKMKLSMGPMSEHTQLGPGLRASGGVGWQHGSRGGAGCGVAVLPTMQDSEKFASSGSQSNRFADSNPSDSYDAKGGRGSLRRGNSRELVIPSQPSSASKTNRLPPRLQERAKEKERDYYSGSANRHSSTSGGGGRGSMERGSGSSSDGWRESSTGAESRITPSKEIHQSSSQMIGPINMVDTPRPPLQRRTSRTIRELSDAEIERKTKSLLDEYVQINDVPEAIACVKELDSPQNIYKFVMSAFNLMLGKTSLERQQTGILLAELVSCNVLTMDQYIKGLTNFLQLIVSDEMEIDIPKIWEYLEELISPMIGTNGMSLQFLRPVCKPLHGSVDKAGLLVALIMHSAQNRLGCDVVQDLWTESTLHWSDFVHPDHVNSFLRKENLEHLLIAEGSLSIERIKKELDGLLRHNEDNLVISKWIDVYVKPSQASGPLFIRALTSLICGNILQRGSNINCKVRRDELKRRCPLLAEYLRCDEDELQALYSLQAFIDKLQHPPDVLSEIFTVLYDEEVISATTFHRWRESDDPAEQLGKGIAHSSVSRFFGWLMRKSE